MSCLVVIAELSWEIPGGFIVFQNLTQTRIKDRFRYAETDGLEMDIVVVAGLFAIEDGRSLSLFHFRSIDYKASILYP